jgi:thioredoxin reductase
MYAHEVVIVGGGLAALRVAIRSSRIGGVEMFD